MLDKFKSFFLFFLLSCLIQACRTSQQNTSSLSLTDEQLRRYEYYYLEATRLKLQRNYDASFEMLQHCLAINPNASSALYELAQYYIYINQVSQGKTALEKAVKNAPDNYWYCQALVNLYQQQKETEKAIELLEKMAVNFPNKIDPLYNLLDIYNHLKEYDKVIALLDRVEARTGKSEQLSMEKFRVYQQKKDELNAFREIETLIAEYPQDVRYQVILGDAYMQIGKQQEAYDIYKKVLTEDPDNAMANYSLAVYYEQTEQTERYEQQINSLLLNKKVDNDTRFNVFRKFITESLQTNQDSTCVIALCDKIMRQEPDDARLPMLYAQYLFAKKMNDEAIPVLRQVLDIEPIYTVARMTLLGEAVRRDDNVDVIQLCEAGVEANPEMLEFYYYLSIAYIQAERTDDVIITCKKALGQVTAESKKDVVSDFYTILADAYHAKGQNSEAYEAYDLALKYNSSNIGALNNYAYYLSLEKRDLDKAEEMSYKTVKAEPNNATYLDTYAWILFEKGNYAEARIYIDEAIKHNTDKSDVIMEHCGDIYYMTGDVDGALKYWNEALEAGSQSKVLKDKIAKKKYISEK